MNMWISNIPITLKRPKQRRDEENLDVVRALKTDFFMVLIPFRSMVAFVPL